MDRHQGEPAYTPGADKRAEHEAVDGDQPPSPSDETLTLQLREEELFAEKRLVQLGVVRIRRQVVTETRMVEVTVSREEMILERLPIEAIGSAESEAITALQEEPSMAERLRALQLGETLRFPITEEEIVIQKRPIVTRELVIDKRLVEEVRRFEDTVRWEDLRIKPVGAEQSESGGVAPGGSDLAGERSPDTTMPAQEPKPAAAQARPAFMSAQQGPLTHPTDATWTLELREEELQAHTQIVDAGAVEIRTGVVSEVESIVVRVAHEETDIEEVPVAHRPADRPIGTGEDIFDIPVYGERVTHRKRPVVTEEITVTKGAVEEVQRVTAAVRREAAHIQTHGEPAS